jgi:hypothetical protein
MVDDNKQDQELSAVDLGKLLAAQRQPLLWFWMFALWLSMAPRHNSVLLQKTSQDQSTARAIVGSSFKAFLGSLASTLSSKNCTDSAFHHKRCWESYYFDRIIHWCSNGEEMGTQSSSA